MMTSLSMPYIFACHVPHPSLKRGGTNLAISPRRLGLLNIETCTLAGNSSSSGNNSLAVEVDPGLVERLRSS